jgi:hypothetical protein
MVPLDSLGQAACGLAPEKAERADPVNMVTRLDQVQAGEGRLDNGGLSRTYCVVRCLVLRLIEETYEA